MQEYQFPCPYCSANLRLRDRHYLGQQIECPDCGQQIVIIQDMTGLLAAVKPEETSASVVKSSATSKSAPKEKKRKKRLTRSLASSGSDSHITLQRKARSNRRSAKNRKSAPQSTSEGASASQVTRNSKFSPPHISESSWGQLLKSPLGIGLMVGVCLAIFLLFSLADSDDKTPEPTQTETAKLSDEQQSSQSLTELANDTPSVETETIRERLLWIANELQEYEQRKGFFPAGSVHQTGLDSPRPLEQRFSWVAELTTHHTGNLISMQTQFAWDDPQNERFVRQAQRELLNPKLFPLVSEQGYPATHFVGVAGVGTNGPTLDADHPRAGIFAYHRSTKQSDIKDGLSNTMMIAGVKDQFGSWAQAGWGTIRPFTREPYINGPDHFGTGSKGSMQVLMADGSVKTVTVRTSPTIIRRMAAMADGLSLDAEVPGEPGAPSTPDMNIAEQFPMPEEPLIAMRPNVGRAGEGNVAGQVNLPPKPIDIEKRLAQQLSQYKMTKAVPLKTLLREMEEMTGVPFRFAQGIRETTLETPVSVNLQKTTLENLLHALLKEVRLTWKKGDSVIHVYDPLEDPATKEQL